MFHLRLEPSQLSLGTAFALFVLDLGSRVGTSYCISGPGLVSKAVEVVAIPGVIGTIQRFNSVFRNHVVGGGEQFVIL